VYQHSLDVCLSLSHTRTVAPTQTTCERIPCVVVGEVLVVPFCGEETTANVLAVHTPKPEGVLKEGMLRDGNQVCVCVCECACVCVCVCVCVCGR